ncbi:hypothetical protein L211DRAFT_558538 [Terfezia boudieri ATCC MYA-4762]|uniref:Secreted protein n=1 Tax=Terfezia boudieri ATCC MYA-4762 TaxID=1051890 RepID=A0A3N4M3T1_9PEZI|nr:hypothetical protein L211DRAFT_558538 [Terfezia boudieri ATCC MYA-4762]
MHQLLRGGSRVITVFLYVSCLVSRISSSSTFNSAPFRQPLTGSDKSCIQIPSTSPGYPAFPKSVRQFGVPRFPCKKKKICSRPCLRLQLAQATGGRRR